MNKPSLSKIFALMAVSMAEAKSLFAIREGFGTRYMKSSKDSQRKRRKLARKANPHGW